MREDKMSKLFRKISPYTEKHLHLLLVSSSTSTQWAGPLYCACVCACVRLWVYACACALIFSFQLNVVYLCVLKGPAWDKRAHRLQETLKSQPHLLLAVCLKRGFQLTSPSKEQPNKNLNNKTSLSVHVSQKHSHPVTSLTGKQSGKMLC